MELKLLKARKYNVGTYTYEINFALFDAKTPITNMHFLYLWNVLFLLRVYWSIA